MKRIIAVYPDYSIFVYRHNDLCVSICEARHKKGEIAAYHAVEITEDQPAPQPEGDTWEKIGEDLAAWKDADGPAWKYYDDINAIAERAKALTEQNK